MLKTSPYPIELFFLKIIRINKALLTYPMDRFFFLSKDIPFLIFINLVLRIISRDFFKVHDYLFKYL